jgi:hypothetical protein
MSYTIITGGAMEVMEGVYHLIQEGWIPQGGISTSGKGHYAQALIKIEEDDGKGAQEVGE